MSATSLNDTFVALCDWRGRVIWISEHQVSLHRPGDFAWEHLSDESRDEVQTAVARVVTLHEPACVEYSSRDGQHFRSWLWPLESPELAVCVLSIAVPSGLSALSRREREILGLLALGNSVSEISKQLKVGTSTIHTHLRRAREKLGLNSMESITGFAARYCHPAATPAIG